MTRPRASPVQSSRSVSSLVTARPVVAGSVVPRGAACAAVEAGAVETGASATPSSTSGLFSETGLMSDARSTPAQFSYGRLPAPRPTASMRKRAGSAREVRSAATIAAPVGVTSSPITGAGTSSMAAMRQRFTTAGTGTGMMPWAQRMVPWPSESAGTMTLVTSKSSRQTATEQMSTMESVAPTSWKSTVSGVAPCAMASASASLPKTARASSLARGVRLDASMMAVTSASERCTW